MIFLNFFVMSTRQAHSFDHTSVFGIPSQHDETVTMVMDTRAFHELLARAGQACPVADNVGLDAT